MATIIQNHQTKINTYIRLFAVLTCCFCLIVGCGNSENILTTESTETTETNLDTESKTSLHRMEVVLNGKKYVYNNHLTNMIIVGVDNEEIPKSTVGSPSSGQADSLFLVSFDRVNGKTNVISIPRDTMTTVDVFDRDGTSLGPSTLQISLSYAFGDGKHDSCRNTKEAVSRLFYRLPIQGYCALTLDSMEKICELFGPITVTIPNDSLSAAYPEMSKGSVIDITVENAEAFLRYRDTSISHSALERSERHQAFLKACEEQIISDLYSNPEIVTDLYAEFEPYMVTNISADQFVDIFEKLDQNSKINSWSIPGEAVSTDNFDEFHVNEDALYENIIEHFFEEVTGE